MESLTNVALIMVAVGIGLIVLGVLVMKRKGKDNRPD